MFQVCRDCRFSTVLSNDLSDEEVLEERAAFDDVQEFCELCDEKVLWIGHVGRRVLDEGKPCHERLVSANVPERNDVRVAVPSDDGASLAKVEKVTRSSPAFLIFLVRCSVEIYLFANFDCFKVQTLRSSVVRHRNAFFHDGAKNILFGFDPHSKVGLEIVREHFQTAFEGRGGVGVRVVEVLGRKA